MEAGKGKACCFFKAAHDVHGVDGLPGRSFHQVIDG